jgi:hypothetical protein
MSMNAGNGRREAPDAFMADTEEKIRKYGWSVIGVAEVPPFAYTVGLADAVPGAPELVCVGLSYVTAGTVLNTIATRMREEGARAAPGRRWSEVLEGHDVSFRAVPAHCSRRYFAVAWARRGGEDFPRLQVIFPDRRGRFPHEAEPDSFIAAVQELDDEPPVFGQEEED